MLIAALAAAVAVSVATEQSQWFAQVEHRRDQVEAQSIASAGVQWARAILDADSPLVDHLGEPWALPLPATPVENGDVQGRIVDAQSMLNANNLVGDNAGMERQWFARLFSALGIPPATLASIIDWIDVDDIAQDGGAEDLWYMNQPDASLAANAPAVRIEELASIRGMTPPAMARMIRFVTALPPGTPLNVNTAAPEVLAASLDIDADGLATLIASRAERPFGSIAEFRSRLGTLGGSLIGPEAMYSVNSHYFLVEVRARQGESIARARAVITRDANVPSSIVWQTME